MAIPTQKTIVIELFVDLFLQTDASTSFVHTELDIPQLEELGPYIEEMYCLTVTRNRTSDHQWTVTVSWSNTGRTWATPVSLFTAITADGETIESAYSTATDFAGLRLKALASCKNGSAGSRESAQASAWLVVRLKT